MLTETIPSQFTATAVAVESPKRLAAVHRRHRRIAAHRPHAAAADATIGRHCCSHRWPACCRYQINNNNSSCSLDLEMLNHQKLAALAEADAAAAMVRRMSTAIRFIRRIAATTGTQLQFDCCIRFFWSIEIECRATPQSVPTDSRLHFLYTVLRDLIVSNSETCDISCQW